MCRWLWLPQIYHVGLYDGGIKERSLFCAIRRAQIGSCKKIKISVQKFAILMQLVLLLVLSYKYYCMIAFFVNDSTYSLR